MKKLLFILLICPALSAREFINLTFDDPDLSNVRPFKPPWEQFPSDYAPVEEVFQGWTISQVFLDELDSSVFKGLASVHGESTLSLFPAFGFYAVNVVEWLGIDWERSAFSLSQIGLVPGDAGTLRWWEGGGHLEVHINGEALPRQRVDTPGLLYETNVSAYAGQEVELSLEFAKGSFYQFDVVGFMPIPEPSPAALLVMGGLFLLVCQRRRTQLIRRQ